MEISIKAMLNTCRDNPDLEVSLTPYDCGSWRGIYAEAAIFVKEGSSTLKEWIPFLEELLAEEFDGYKGGEYSYYEHTSLHIEYSHSRAADILWMKLFLNPTFVQRLELALHI